MQAKSNTVICNTVMVGQFIEYLNECKKIKDKLMEHSILGKNPCNQYAEIRKYMQKNKKPPEGNRMKKKYLKNLRTNDMKEHINNE